jgi:methylmalonyl-CoA/ethylmalonyl-CoA epimerase
MSNGSTSEHAASPAYRKIDHIAIAVRDLEAAIQFFTEVLNFTLQRRLTIRGSRTGMNSAEMIHGDIKFVLCQGTEPESVISRLVNDYGPGIAHIALAVDDVHKTTDILRKTGATFNTSVIEGPGLRQVFTRRDENSGLSFELTERTSEEGFLEENVQNLFEQLENSQSY